MAELVAIVASIVRGLSMSSQIDALFGLKDRRALVTGGSRGLGLAMAKGLAQAGAEVMISGRNSAALAAAAADLRQLGLTIATLELDQTDIEALGPSIAQAGPFDILVNNAGVEQICPSLEVTPSLWDKILDTNLKGSFFTAQAVAKGMQAKGRGAIVNLCSLTSYVGVPTAVAYGASKSGLLGMTRALSAEWAAHGIRVNAIAPGYFRTEMTEVFYQDENWAAAMLDKIPQGRFGEGQDLVGALVFLCSDASAYITGQCLGIDGGYLASI